MNREEARTELDACTLRPQDATEEARALARQDAELGQWLERRTAFDEKVAAAMRVEPVPTGRQASLLQAMRVEAAKARRPWGARSVGWLAAAAVIVLSFVGWWWQATTASGWEGEALAKVSLIDHGMMPLDHWSPKLAELRQTLASTGALVPVRVPARLEQLKTYGCKVIQVAGKPASVVCFEMAPGEEVHLVVMAGADLPQPPPQHHPRFKQQGAWHIASWSEGSQSYLLMTRGSMEKLKALLALRVPAQNGKRLPA